MLFYQDNLSTIHCGDSAEILKTLESNSIDTCITDPPAGIAFMGKHWDKDKGGREQWIAWLVGIMAEVLRVLKPGAMCLVWSLPRTSHWTGMALEDAGFEIRDCIQHLFGTGFPKSLDVGKALDKAAGAEREVLGVNPAWRPNKERHSDNGWSPMVQGEAAVISAPTTGLAKLWDGYGTALKPAAEVWWLAMKPIEGTFAENAQKWGVVGLNIDGARVGTDTDRGNRYNGKPPLGGKSKGIYSDMPGENVWKVKQGRWPANVVLDEEAGAMLDEQSGVLHGHGSQRHYGSDKGTFPWGTNNRIQTGGESGGASRFFYCTKPSSNERNEGLEDFYWRKALETEFGFVRIDKKEWAELPERQRAQGNVHLTVKSIKFIEYLCKLTGTPTGGIVLDPFMGSGSILKEAKRMGRQAIGIDLYPENCEMAEARLNAKSEAERRGQETLDFE